jgi:membrane-associated HD superfamily phosphohydrolase
MEMIIFITLIACFLMLMMASSFFPDQRSLVLISSLAILVLGVMLIGTGISWNGVTALNNSFTGGIGVMLSLFGMSMGITSGVTA